MFLELDGSELPEIVESLCMQCEETGVSRLLFTKIPHFKEIIIVSFSCQSCGWRSTTVQFAGEIPEKGVALSLAVNGEADLNRRVVQSDYSTLKIPELEFEIPPAPEKASLSTIEGILQRAAENLTVTMPRYAEEAQGPLVEFVKRISELSQGAEPFTLIIDDPSGNSYVENLCAPNVDPALTVSLYNRTVEQNRSIGISLPEDATMDSTSKHEVDDESMSKIREFGDEPIELPGTCSVCHHDVPVKMYLTDIPNFRQVIIMSSHCDSCGYRTNEIKTGGPMPEMGTRISLNVKTEEDLNRDVLKADSAMMSIPELELELLPGTLGGKFTTIEGLLASIKEKLNLQQMFVYGDSRTEEELEKFRVFFEKLDKCKNGETPFTLLIDDPLSASYIQTPYAPDPDPEMTVEEYVRTEEQDIDLGIADMRVEEGEY